MAKILLVDDEITLVQMVAELLRSEGHQVVPFTSSRAAVDAFTAVAPELVIMNLCPEKARGAGLDIVQSARSSSPPAVVLMITAARSTETALEAMKKGAYDYLDRPFALDELKLRVQRALAYHAALSENVRFRKQLQSEFQFKGIIGSSASMLELLKLIERIADTESPVLILGQPGTGKELVARTIHFNSRRRFGPFVPVNCSLLSEQMLEAELFGERQAAACNGGAEARGVFVEAEGGTLFLDEVGALSASLQSRLLKSLESGELRRNGDSAPARIDVRILAANRESLEKKVGAGSFHPDLFRRLGAFSLALPPLRERAEDIPLLISHFLAGRIHPRTGKPCGIMREAVEVCSAYAWPGNVQELENALERACVLSEDSMIRLSDFPPTIQQRVVVTECHAPARDQVNGASLAQPPGVSAPAFDRILATASFSNDRLDEAGGLVPLKKFLRDQELGYLHRTLAHVGGSKERAAELLGISLATIYRKLSEPQGEPSSV